MKLKRVLQSLVIGTVSFVCFSTTVPSVSAATSVTENVPAFSLPSIFKKSTKKPTTQTSEKTKIKNAEKALSKAESEPTDKNYQAAEKKIKKLKSSKTKTAQQDRLKIVKKHIKIYQAVIDAEKSKSPDDLKTASKLVKKATLNKTDYQTRLSAVETDIAKIAQQKALDAQIADATAKIEKAAATKTDADIQTAEAAVNAIPAEKNQELNNQLATVKNTIMTERQAAEQKAAEEAAAQAAAAEQAAIQPAYQAQPVVEQTVLITPTGTKYHSHKCGKGDYQPTSLENAQQQGFEPCKRCYG